MAPVPPAIEWLRTVGEVQARICRQNGSPTYEAIVDALLGALDGDSAAAELLRADPGDPAGTALYLRFLGAVHRLVLADAGSPLRPFFPSTGGTVDADAVVPVFFDVVAEHRDYLAQAMQAEVQTNEVGRAAVLSAAVNWVVEHLGGPVRLLEVGASAGLNLWLDRYRVVAGTTAWGPPGSPVELRDHFVSGTPPTPRVDVVERRGCDRHPLDIAHPSTRDLLRSFVWPEHTDRLARLDAAFEVADAVAIDEADACDWLAAQTAALPDGATTVVFHSVVMQYLEPGDVARFEETIRAAAHPRLAWVAMEPTPDYSLMEFTAELGRPAMRSRLATATPHGRDICWAPTTPSAPPRV